MSHQSGFKATPHWVKYFKHTHTHNSISHGRWDLSYQMINFSATAIRTCGVVFSEVWAPPACRCRVLQPVGPCPGLECHTLSRMVVHDENTRALWCGITADSRGGYSTTTVNNKV